MIESDSLDRITLENNLLQNGGGLDEIVRELLKIIMFIFLKIKFSDKIFLQVPQATKQSTQKLVPPSQARALPAPPPPSQQPARSQSVTTSAILALPVPLSTPRPLPLPPAPKPQQQPPALKLQPAPKSLQSASTPWYQFWPSWGGGNNKKKIKKNITRLYNCYILSLNQNGGTIIHNELSLKIKKRLNKKITELKNLEGGTSADDFYNELLIKTELVIKKDKEVKDNLKISLRPILLQTLSIEKDNIFFAQYIKIINSLKFDNIINFNELIIWNIIKILIEEKKTEIKNEYDKTFGQQKGGKYNNLEGGDITIKNFLEKIGLILLGIILLPILIIFVLLVVCGLLPSYESHEKYSNFWSWINTLPHLNRK